MAELDITDCYAVEKLVTETGIVLIVNCAAYTTVDKAEDDVAMGDKINRRAVKNLAEVSCETNLTLIHVSTDYVFDGTKKYALYSKTMAVQLRLRVYGKQN